MRVALGLRWWKALWLILLVLVCVAAALCEDCVNEVCGALLYFLCLPGVCLVRGAKKLRRRWLGRTEAELSMELPPGAVRFDNEPELDKRRRATERSGINPAEIVIYDRSGVTITNGQETDAYQSPPEVCVCVCWVLPSFRKAGTLMSQSWLQAGARRVSQSGLEEGLVAALKNADAEAEEIVFRQGQLPIGQDENTSGANA